MIDPMEHVGIVGKVIKDNFSTVYSVEWDDLWQMGCVGLVLGCNSYDESKGKISTYLYRCVLNEIGKHFQAEKTKMRSACSTVHIGQSPWVNSIPSSFDLTEVVYYRLRLEGLFAGLSDRDKKVLALLMAGYTLTEVAAVYGRSYQWVANIRNSAVKKAEHRENILKLRAKRLC